MSEMDMSKSASTPVENGAKLMKATDGDDSIGQELYQSAVESLLYLSAKTRSDITYNIGNDAGFSSQPSQTHWVAVKRIMRYLSGTLDYGLL